MSEQPRGPRRSSGVRLAAAPRAGAGGTTPDYPGKRFGLPRQGPGSAAPMGLRLGALLIDWVLCELVVSLVTRHSLARPGDGAYQATQYWTFLVCAVEIYLLTAVSGLTIGKRALGLKVIRTNGGRPGFGWAAVRTLLLFCAVPPLFGDSDQRGLHDRAADTIVVRTRLSPAARHSPAFSPRAMSRQATGRSAA